MEPLPPILSEGTAIAPPVERAARHLFRLYCGGDPGGEEITSSESFGLAEYMGAEKQLHAALGLTFDARLVEEEFTVEMASRWPAGPASPTAGRVKWTQYQRWVAAQQERHACTDAVMVTYLERSCALLAGRPLVLPPVGTAMVEEEQEEEEEEQEGAGDPPAAPGAPLPGEYKLRVDCRCYRAAGAGAPECEYTLDRAEIFSLLETRVVTGDPADSGGGATVWCRSADGWIRHRSAETGRSVLVDMDEWDSDDDSTGGGGGGSSEDEGAEDVMGPMAAARGSQPPGAGQRGKRRMSVSAEIQGRRTVSRPFPSWSRSILTEIYLCHACSYHEIEDGNGRAGGVRGGGVRVGAGWRRGAAGGRGAHPRAHA
jgi:hypothetical protein